MNTKRMTRWILAAWLLAPALNLAAADKVDVDNVESVTIKNGVLLAKAEGQSSEATNEISFPHDIVILTNGTFKVAGGKKRTLDEGQVLTRDGVLTSPDGSVVPVFDHLKGKANRVFLVKDGDEQPLTGVFTLKDGTRVEPNGRMVTTKNVIRRLLDGQIIKLNETGVESTDTARLEKGRVILYKDGGRIELRPGQVMAMSDGSRIDSQGLVVKPGGARVQLKEGQLFKFDGAGNTK